MELLNELDDSDDTESPSEALTINSVSIYEVVDSEPSDKKAPTEVNEVWEDTLRLMSPPKWARSKQFEVDFPKGL